MKLSKLVLMLIKHNDEKQQNKKEAVPKVRDSLFFIYMESYRA